MTPKPIKIAVTVPAPPREVFAALTDAKTIRLWSEQRGSVQPRVGGKVELFDGWVKGKVLEYKPGKALAYTWQPGDWDGAVKSTVRYTFSATRSGTKITLTHSGFPNEHERKNHYSGWYEYVFGPLKTYFLQRQGL